MFSGDSDKRKRLMSEAVSISEKLWRENPDRLILAKHAISGYAKIAKYALVESENELALAACKSGMDLFKSAWKTFEDEFWVIENICPSLVIWVDVLVANGELEQALLILDDADRYLAIRRAKYPLDMDLHLAMLNTGLTRLSVLYQMGNEQAAQTELNRLVQVVEKSKSQQGFLEAMRDLLKSKKLPDSVCTLLGS